MQNQLNNFYQTIEKKYLPNGEKDKAVGTDVIFNLLNKEVDAKVCESIFLKSLAILALNNRLTIGRLKEHLIASKTIDLFSEEQIKNLYIFLNKVEDLATQGKGASQIIEKTPQQAVNIATANHESKSSQVTIALIIIGASLIFSGFYWYQVRPSEIRKNCFTEVYGNELGASERDKREYSVCLSKYGLDE